MKAVTICGSLKFQKEMIIEAQRLALLGNCILTLVYPVLDYIEITKEQLKFLKEDYFKKI